MTTFLEQEADDVYEEAGYDEQQQSYQSQQPSYTEPPQQPYSAPPQQDDNVYDDPGAAEPQSRLNYSRQAFADRSQF